MTANFANGQILTGPALDAAINSTDSRTISSPTGGNLLTLDGNSGYGREIAWTTAGSLRWQLGASATPEAGANVGSDMVLTGYADNGSTVLGSYLTVARGSGEVTIASLSLVRSAGGVFQTFKSFPSTLRLTAYYSSGNEVWSVGVNSDTESGANAGASWVLNGYSDAGALLGTWLTVTRANGAVSMPGDLTANSLNATTNILGVGLTLTGTALITNSTGGSLLALRSNAGTAKMTNYLSGASLRWTEGVVTGAESGGNAGTNWQLNAYSDTQVLLGTWFGVTRSNGAISMPGAVTAGSLIVTTASAFTQAGPTSPTGTTSAVGVMMGLAGSITPTCTGRVQVTITGNLANATGIGDGAVAQFRYGTGGAPANAAALTGTAAGSLSKTVSATTAQVVPFTCGAIVALTPGTAYWLDMSLQATVAGTATATSVCITAAELR